MKQHVQGEGEGSLGASGEAACTGGRGGESGSFWWSSKYRGKGRGVWELLVGQLAYVLVYFLSVQQCKTNIYFRRCEYSKQ